MLRDILRFFPRTSVDTPFPPPSWEEQLHRLLCLVPQSLDPLYIPFQFSRFSVNLARCVTQCKTPYLRHSWMRTDIVSVDGCRA